MSQGRGKLASVSAMPVQCFQRLNRVIRWMPHPTFFLAWGLVDLYKPNASDLLSQAKALLSDFLISCTRVHAWRDAHAPLIF